MDEYAIGVGTLVKLGETFDGLARVFETSAENEGLVAPLLAVGEGDLVVGRIEISHGCVALNSGPGVNHGGQRSCLHLQGLDVLMEDAEVGLRLYPDSVLRYDADLEFIGTLVCLEVLGEGTTVGATCPVEKINELRG